LLHYLLHEPLGYRPSLPRVSRLFGYAFHLFTRAAILWTNPVDAGMGIVTLYYQCRGWDGATVFGLSNYGIPYISISVSLNILLTLMIVIRLVLYGRKTRTATGPLAGISALYNTVSTMFIESCALFTVSSLLVVGPLAAYTYNLTPNIWIIGACVVEIFFPILAEIQVRAFPQRPSLGQLFNATDGSDRLSLHCSSSSGLPTGAR